MQREIVGITCVSFSLAIGLVGCGGAISPPGELSSTKAIALLDGGYRLEIATLSASEEAGGAPDGTPGESEASQVDGMNEATNGSSTRAGSGGLAAKDCVYVQWCNEPGPRGTICRLRPGCAVNNATVQECINETYSVCGAPVRPWYLY